MKKMILFATIGLIGIIAASPFTAQAGGDVKESEVNFVGGDVVDMASQYPKLLGHLKQCQQDLKDCDEQVKTCMANYNECKVTLSKVTEKKKSKGGGGGNHHKTPRQVCVSTKYNGVFWLSGWDGLADICGIEAQMDGTCMTGKEAYKGLVCLNAKFDDLELQLEMIKQKIEEMDSGQQVTVYENSVLQQDPVDTSAFVMKKELQTEIKKLMGWINSILAANAERDEKIAGLEEELLKLRDRVSDLENRLRIIEACFHPEDHVDAFETDVYGKIVADDYREKCGILADIPEIRDELDGIKKCLSFSDAFHNRDEFKKACKGFNWVLEVQSALDGVYLCEDPLHSYWNGDMNEYAFACPFYVDQICDKMAYEDALIKVDGDEAKLKEICQAGKKVKAVLGKKPGFAGMCFGTFRGDVWCGGGLNWTALLIKKHDKTVVEFSVFVGALAGVTSEADGGITYGGDIAYYPGPQDVFALFIGYQGLSSGVFVAEYPDQPDPDTQHHAVMLGIKLKKDWLIKEVDGKLFKAGIFGSAGAGPCWQDDSSGSGVTGCWKGEIGFSISVEW